jgi:hypothetical protein
VTSIFSVGDKVRVKKDRVQEWREKGRINTILLISHIFESPSTDDVYIRPTTHVTAKYSQSWFDLVPADVPLPKFKQGDKVRVPEKHQGLWASVAGKDVPTILTIDEWVGYNSGFDGYSHRYTVKDTKEFKSKLVESGVGEAWFEPYIESPVGPKWQQAPKLVDTALDYYYYYKKAVTITPSTPNPVNIPIVVNRSVSFTVHVCYWCGEPITKCEKGEFKGHWQHAHPQMSGIQNYWVCDSNKTKDRRGHLAALDTSKSEAQGWTASAETTFHDNILIKGRRFKGE